MFSTPNRTFMILFFALFASLARLPDQYTVTERFFSFPSRFDLNSDEGVMGVARREFFALSANYYLEDPDGHPVASSISHFFSWVTETDVCGPEGEKIGRFEEEFFRILPYAQYRLYDGNHQLQAVAEMDLFGIEFRIYPPDNPDHLYATISRPVIPLYRDIWTVNIYDRSFFENKILDPSLLSFIAIHQTDKDNYSKFRKEIIDRLLLDVEDYQGRR